MTIGEEEREAVFRAAMALAAEGRWRDRKLSDIAAAAGTGDLGGEFRGKTGVLEALAEAVDARVAERADDAFRDPDIPARERLLELLLLRFEAMAPYRAGVAALLRGLPRDPALAARGLPALRRSMRATLEAAGLGGRGPCAALRAAGLAAVFLDAARVWSGDDSPDLAATARRLDDMLRRVERAVLALGRGPRSADAPAAGPAGE